MTTLQPGDSIKPIIDCDEAKALVEKHFQKTVVSIKEIISYDDKNFYVKTKRQSEHCENDQVDKFIFKVLNSMDSLKTGHIQTEHEVMEILHSNGVTCPLPQKDLEGKTFSMVQLPVPFGNANETRTHLIRLLSFVEGETMYNVPINETLLVQTGEYIAQIEKYLEGFSFPVLDEHQTIWKLAEVLQLRKFIYVIKDEPEKYKLVEDILAAYETSVKPIIPQLDKGALHGDYNEQNIIVAKSASNPNQFEIRGIIDFGDMHSGPYVFELAITICYMMLESLRCKIVDPYDSAAHVVAGYSKIKNVSEMEFEILRILVACRLCQSVVMGAYTHSKDPSNTYVLTTQERGWTLLNELWNNKSDSQFASICKRYQK